MKIQLSLYLFEFCSKQTNTYQNIIPANLWRR